MQGTFDGADDGYDTKRHNIHVNMQAGAMLKDAITGSVNHTLTSAGVVEIVGSMLKVAGKNAKNGVYFIDSNNKAHKATTIVDNKPARLIVIAPDLPQGEYTLQITTQHSHSSSLLKNPRTGIFDRHLTVTVSPQAQAMKHLHTGHLSDKRHSSSTQKHTKNYTKSTCTPLDLIYTIRLQWTHE